MKQLVLIICIVTVWSAGTFSQQQDFPVLKGPYLGQKLPGNTPEPFAPGVVSTTAHEFACSFTPNGNEFYFSRRDSALGVPVIMVSKLRNGAWTKPEIAPFVEMQYLL